jgi:hypothetical protein
MNCTCKCSTVTLLLTLLLATSTSYVDAYQQSVDQEIDLTRVPATPADTQGIEVTLKQLQEEMERLQRSLLNSDTQKSTTARISLSSEPQDVPTERRQNSELHQDARLPEPTRAASQIYRQIELIKQMIREKQALPPVDTTTKDNVAQPPTVANGQELQVPDQPNDASALFNSVQSANPPSRLPTTEGSPLTISQISSHSVRILPEPVDLFEMGNSLFEASDVAAALKAYDSVNKSELSPSDAVWLEYLTACCKRTLGELDTAEAIFRQVSNENSHPQLVEASRWWLKQIGRRRMANETMSEIETEFDALMEGMPDHDTNRTR